MIRIAILSGLLFFATAMPAHPAPAASRPNFLVIFSDDQGQADVGCYGSEIPTPHLDSLAKDGVQFTNGYVASSICTPSRFGLLTGQYPSRSKDRLLGPLMFLEQRDLPRGIQQGETTIAQVLSNSGYHSALIGKWHLGHGSKKRLPLAHGFDRFTGHTGGCIDFFTMRYGIKQDWYHGNEHKDTVGYATDVITNEAIKFLEGDRPQDKPFFLFLSYNAPHFAKGWDVGRQQVINFMQAHPRDLKRVKHIEDPIRRQFAAKVVGMDESIGQVFKTMKKTGLEENTIVLFLTDNGGDPKYGGSNKPFRGKKATLFEGGIRIPFLARWPGTLPAGSVWHQPITSLDFFPTFCALAGANAPAHLPQDGVDLSNAWKSGEEFSGEREILFELHTAQALRAGNLKYLKDQTGSYLFDLKRDPYEKVNLAETQSDDFQRLQKRCQTLLSKILEN